MRYPLHFAKPILEAKPLRKASTVLPKERKLRNVLFGRAHAKVERLVKDLDRQVGGKVAPAFFVPQDLRAGIDPELDLEGLSVAIQRVVEHRAGSEGPGSDTTAVIGRMSA